jgi:hypothetical protein
MEAKVCNYTHLLYKITHLRCARLQTIWCVKLHTFVLHTFYLSKPCYFTHLLGKTHLCRLHTFQLYSPFPLLHTLWIYTLSQYFTHLLNIHTFPNFTHLLNIHTFPNFTHLLNIHTVPNFTHLLKIHTFLCYNTPFDRKTVYCMPAFFMRYMKIKSVKSAYLGV